MKKTKNVFIIAALIVLLGCISVFAGQISGYHNGIKYSLTCYKTSDVAVAIFLYEDSNVIPIARIQGQHYNSANGCTSSFIVDNVQVAEYYALSGYSIVNACAYGHISGTPTVFGVGPVY